MSSEQVPLRTRMSEYRRGSYALAVALCLFAAGCLPQGASVDRASNSRSTAAPTRAREETTKRIYGIVAEQMHIDGSTLTPETSLGSLQMDELDIDETVLWTEEEFGVRITDDEFKTTLNGKSTLADLADLVEQARGRPTR